MKKLLSICTLLLLHATVGYGTITWDPFSMLSKGYLVAVYNKSPYTVLVNDTQTINPMSTVTMHEHIISSGHAIRIAVLNQHEQVGAGRIYCGPSAAGILQYVCDYYAGTSTSPSGKPKAYTAESGGRYGSGGDQCFKATINGNGSINFERADCP